MIDIIKKRKALKLSQSKLAKRVGVSTQAISNIENGRAKPSVETAKKLGDELGFPWWQLFE